MDFSFSLGVVSDKESLKHFLSTLLYTPIRTSYVTCKMKMPGPLAQKVLRISRQP